MFGKDDQVAEIFADAAGFVTRLRNEKTRLPFGREMDGAAYRIDADAGRRNRTAVNVAGKNLQFVSAFQRLQLFLQEDGQRIGFLACGAAGHPDADHGIGGSVGEELRDDLFLQRLEGFRVAKKTGHADEQVAKKGFHLRRGLLEIPDVSVHHLDLVDGHAPFDAAVDGAGFVLGEIVTRLGAQEDEDFFHGRLGLGWRGGKSGRCGMV